MADRLAGEFGTYDLAMQEFLCLRCAGDIPIKKCI